MKRFIFAICATALMATNAFAARSEMGDNVQTFEQKQGAKITAYSPDAAASADVKVFKIPVAEIESELKGGVHVNTNYNDGEMGDNIQTFKQEMNTEIFGSTVRINNNVNTSN